MRGVQRKLLLLAARKHGWRAAPHPLRFFTIAGALLFLLCSASHARAAVSFNNSGNISSDQTFNGTGLTWSHTVSSGSNRALFVELAIDGLGAPATAVSYGGVPLTRVGRGAGNHAVEIWVLVAPLVGTANVVVTFGGSTAAVGGAVTFNGVNQTTPAGSFGSASGTGNNASVTVASAVGDLVIDAQYWHTGTPSGSPGSGQTVAWWEVVNLAMLGGSTTEPGAASVTMSGSSLFVQWEIGAVSIKAATPMSISGTVFEDPNYGGGAGRSKAAALAAGGSGRSGARVELFDGAGSYQGFTTSDAAGAYTFSGLDAGSYSVRVVNSSVSSGRTGYVAGLLPAQTYQTDASGGTASGVADHVGGELPSKADAGNGSTTLAALTTATTAPQSVTAVALGSADVTGVDFGYCFDVISNTNNAGQGSLRQFLTNANTLGGDAGLVQSGLVAAKENAVFMISNGSGAPGLRPSNNYFSGGVATITPTALLPSIVAPLVLDGQQQPGWTGNPVLVLNGGGTVTDGLELYAGSDGSTVRGLVIQNFTRDGIDITGSSGNTVVGNWIGLNQAGSAAAGNQQGVNLWGANNNSIGGINPADRNVISGNSGSGVSCGNGSTGNLTRGNYIGTNVSGSAAVANNIGLLWNLCSSSTIGGSSAGERNIISGNKGAGVYLQGAGTNSNSIKGNYIGTDVAGTAALGNGIVNNVEGVGVAGGASNSIGGTGAGEGNRIWFNGTAGVAIASGTGNAILGNSISGNVNSLGIDLFPWGVSANNGTKNAGAANFDMDFPVFSSASLNGTTLALAGYVGSAPNQSTFAGARVEIFQSDNDASGFGEGKTYLGSLTADASGNLSGSIDVSGKGLTPGDRITGTATDAANNSSEFGANTLVVGYANLSLTLTDNPDPAAVGGEVLYGILLSNAGPDTANNVTLTNTLPAGVTLVSATPSQGSCSGTTTVVCNLGSLLNTGTANVEILVVTSSAGTLSDSASVTAAETDVVPANNSAAVTTQVVAGITTRVPLTQHRRIHGFVDSAVTGGSLRSSPNTGNPCAVASSSAAALSGIPASATVVSAYLYWAGSGSSIDSQVTLDGVAKTADQTYTARYVLGATNYDYFGAYKDVTGEVQTKRNGSYSFGGLSVDTTNPYCSSQAVIAGWSLFVIYSDSSASGKTIVLYDGFDIRRNDSTTYNLTGIFVSSPPQAKTTVLVWEGDENLSGGENLLFNGSALSDAYNPLDNLWNSTINTLGSSSSYGVDLDTFDVSSRVAARDTLATATVSTGADLIILNSVLLQVSSNIITGKVFEDVNYGGGVGRDLATAAAAAPGFSIARPGAGVELYDSTGSWIRSTTTDSTGLYGFAGMPDGDYTVRVVNGTVTSSRPGSNGSERAVQTFRTDTSTGSAVAVTNEVGGASPNLQDAPANSSANLAGIVAQSKAPARIITGTTVTDVNFGFNFDTIVNKNDSGQGSLNQFIANANQLGNAGLAQAGQPAGKETSIFMISDGAAHPGLKAGLPNQLSGGVAAIQCATALPAISDSDTVIDGTTQTANVGDSNPAGPELEISGNGLTASGISASGASGVGVKGVAVYGFAGSGANGNGVYLNNAANGFLLGCNLGSTASGSAALANAAAGVALAGTSSGISIGGVNAGEGNLIAYNGTNGITLGGSGAGTAVSGNTIRNNARSGVYATTPGVTIAKNLIRNNGGAFDGIWLDSGGAGAKVYQNTVHGNGRDGIRVGDSGASIKNNLFTGNAGYGINRIAASMTEAYNGVTAAAMAPSNTLGRGNVALDPSDLNQNPLYLNAALGNYTLTECASPAINAGIDLGADQPDLNGAAAGLWNNNAPDLGAFESSASCAPSLGIIKQAWDPNGAAPLTSLTAPVGSTIVFLIYVKNTTGGPVSDLRINDALDETAFQYQAGSLVRSSAATPPSDSASNLAIFTATAPGTGTPLSDAVDGDVASALNTGGLPDIDRITIGAVAGQANAPLSLAGHTSFGLHFKVKIK